MSHFGPHPLRPAAPPPAARQEANPHSVGRLEASRHEAGREPSLRWSRGPDAPEGGRDLDAARAGTTPLALRPHPLRPQRGLAPGRDGADAPAAAVHPARAAQVSEEHDDEHAPSDERVASVPPIRQPPAEPAPTPILRGAVEASLRVKAQGERPRVIALANQKGGVGKTTTAINLGTALAAIGERVLIVDLDPQGNASTGLGLDRRDRLLSTCDVMLGDATLAETLVETAVPRLSVAPSTLDLLGVELAIAGERDRAHRLRAGIASLVAADAEREDEAGFTYVLIDCPPSLNLLTINAMTAADAVLVPLQCEFFALEGLSQLLKTVEQVRASVNPELEIHGVVLTMVDPRNNLSAQVAADVRGFMGDKVYETTIPRNVRVSEAPSYGKPALLYDLKCAGSQAYLRLASEVISRERRLRLA